MSWNREIFFSDAPTDTFQRTASEIEQSLFWLGQLILSLPILARPILLNPENRRRISELMDAHKLLNQKVSKHCKNELLKQTFGQIAVMCETIPAHYFSIPVIAEDCRQPDLVAPKIDEPQIAQ